MAGRRFYEPVSGDLTLWADPKDFVKEDLEEEVLELEFLMAQGDPVRERLGNCAGFQTLEQYDAYLGSEWSRKKDIIDFFDYLNTTLELTVKDGTWFTPIAVESVCGEDVGHEAIYTIDGETNTYWEHDDDEEHEIIWKLRDYKKRISKLRVRVGSSSRNLLTGLDVYVASTIGGVFSENNKFAEDISFIINNTWTEIPFSSKANGIYIRFANFKSSQPDNWVRIQEIEAFVVTVEYD